MRAVVADNAGLLEILNKRLDDLSSLISLEFDSSSLQVTGLYLLKEKHESRYLNELSPCYCYLTLREYRDSGGFRAGNGQRSTLFMPLFLTWNHALSSLEIFRGTFTKLANVSIEYDLDRSRGNWRDIWIPDILASLINQSLADFAKDMVTEPAVQFLLDALRLLIFCCEAPDWNGELEEGEILPLSSRMSPDMVPLMRKFLLDFIYHPNKLGRDTVPDL